MSKTSTEVRGLALSSDFCRVCETLQKCSQSQASVCRNCASRSLQSYFNHRILAPALTRARRRGSLSCGRLGAQHRTKFPPHPGSLGGCIDPLQIASWAFASCAGGASPLSAWLAWAAPLQPVAAHNAAGTGPHHPPCRRNGPCCHPADPAWTRAFSSPSISAATAKPV